MKLVVILLLSWFFVSSNISAQEEESILDFDFGADLVSRYVWRGLEFGGDPAVPQFQPYAALSFDGKEYGRLEIGAWGSYGFSGDFSENDLSLKYIYTTSLVNISAVLNDYYYPYLGSSFTNFEDKGDGAHTIEAGIAISGNGSFPFSLLISRNVWNDFPHDRSLYVEAGYAFNIKEINMNIFAGAAQGQSLWHCVTTDKFEFINIGVSAGKSLKISEDYSLPLGISWIMNAHQKKTFLVFKIGLF